jgi:hypothetical protein
MQEREKKTLIVDDSHLPLVDRTRLQALADPDIQIEELLMVKKEFQPLYKNEDERFQLEEARRPKPTHMKEPVDVVEYCVQVMIDGMLDGGSHFALVDQMNALVLEREEFPIQLAMHDGHKFFILAMCKRVPIPIYWAGQEWSTDVSKAHQFDNFKSLVYWRGKVYARYAKILHMLLTARVKGKADAATK